MRHNCKNYNKLKKGNEMSNEDFGIGERDDSIGRAFSGLYYSGGNMLARESGSRKPSSGFFGFWANYGTDEMFDKACQGFGELIDVSHMGGVIEKHWGFPFPLTVYPLILGVPAIKTRECLNRAERAASWGVKVRWIESDDGVGKGKSYVGIHIYVKEFLDRGYSSPLVLSVKSRMTDHLLSALGLHLDVAKVADTILDRTKHPQKIGLWELGMPLLCGEQQLFGKDQTTTVAPIVSGHPLDKTQWDKAYFHEIYLSGENRKSILERIKEDWQSVQEWAALPKPSEKVSPIEESGGYDENPVYHEE